MPGNTRTVRTGGHAVRITSPGRVLYPATGTTKAEVVDYFLAVADVMLPHLIGRPATRKRWPEGVDGPEFFAKDLEPGVPAWIDRVRIDHTSGPKDYPLLTSPAALAWLGQVSALEVHVPQWRIDQGRIDPPSAAPGVSTTRSTRWPDRVVFDLDPGPGVGLAECVVVAELIRERLDGLGDRLVPVTSGSKGLHLYVPMDAPLTAVAASTWARAVAERIEEELPQLAVSRMTKSLRVGKVLVDWSQNNAKKTTIAPYSMRGRPTPTVAAPRTWTELREPHLRHLDFREVLERVADGLDPLAALLPGAPAEPAPAPPDPRPDPPPVRPRVQVASRVGLPDGLAGPVAVALARAQDTLPGPRALTGGTRYELKWDGYRMAAVHDADGLRLWTRNGTDLTDRFPEIAAAAVDRLPVGSVVDGEIVVWNGARLDFDLLQRRLARPPTRIGPLVREHPASFVAFDLLAVDGADLRGRPLRERRARLEDLADWTPPLQLSPITDDVAEARAWMADFRPAGVEGVVAKGAGGRYQPGRREWIKVKSRETEEVVVGAVTGTLRRPDAVVAGRFRGDEFVVVGRSTPLTAGQASALAGVLEPAEPDHPWPDVISSGRFGGAREPTPIIKVAPTVVVEVAADTGQQAGVWRHALRYHRIRADLRPEDVPTLD